MPKPKKRIDQITDEIDRLVTWMLKNKPENRVIRVYENDYKYLMRADLWTLEHGFQVNDNRICFKGYDLIPFKD